MTTTSVSSTAETFPPRPETPEDLRTAVRGVLDSWRADGRLKPRLDSWMRGRDMDFTADLAAHGLLGVSWPKPYGAARGAVARMSVTEELLRAGAPVTGHWIAERQIGPAIVQHGTQQLQDEILPGIAAGKYTVCLGMSESEAGSDLANVRTKAEQDGEGWRITGAKIWTTYAHTATHAYVLARTSTSERKHEGLTEFLVDMSSPGVSVRPIFDLAGEHHFNETLFEDVWVPAHYVIGEVGNGWKQVTEQLSFERGGMERILSTYPLLGAFVDAVGTDEVPATDQVLRVVGELTSRLVTLRQIAFEVASAMDAGQAPIAAAARLKLLGTTFERELIDEIRNVTDVVAGTQGDSLGAMIGQATMASPGFSIRGGTDEVLMTLIGRGGSGDSTEADPVRDMVDDVLRDNAPQPHDLNDKLVADGLSVIWPIVTELGWIGVDLPEALGGGGGSLTDLASIVRASARHAVMAPLLETATAAWALAGSAQPVADGEIVTIAFADTIETSGEGDSLTVTASAKSVGWAEHATRVLLAGKDASGEPVAFVLPLSGDGVTRTDGANLAGEPRSDVSWSGVAAKAAPDAPSADALAGRLSLLTAVAMLGAIDRAAALTEEHLDTRIQFGKPLRALQAMSQSLALIRCERAMTAAAVGRAVAAAEADHGSGETAELAIDLLAVARVIADRSASKVARTAHQVHGAMGVTREHSLHLATTRLWAWRDEVGSAKTWARSLGAKIADGGEPALWALVIS